MFFSAILFPINRSQHHWIFACVCLIDKRIRCYDGSPEHVVENKRLFYVNGLFKCIKDDCIERWNHEPTNWTKLKLTFRHADNPVQPNGNAFVY